MKQLSLLLVLLCAATPFVSGQQSTKSGGTPKPEDGSFVQNTYHNDFFGFSYVLPSQWHKSRVAPAPLPSGAYYLFIADRDTGHSLTNRVMVIADAESNYRSGLSAHDYVSAIIRAQVTHAKAEVTREPSPFVLGGNRFLRADYKRAEDGTTVYNSLVCTRRNNYWLTWNYVAPSGRELDDAVKTLQHISFGQKSYSSQHLR